MTRQRAIRFRSTTIPCLLLLAITSCNWASAADGEWPVLIEENFEAGMERWRTTDVDKPHWQLLSGQRDGETSTVLRVTGASNYQPPFRSPHSIALLKEPIVTDFELTVRAQNTNSKAGGHRDLCLFWGYQDPAHFYYVHFGAQADPHSCQIFIVNNAPRIKITVDESPGTPWTDAWHTLRVTRTTADGMIRVYFDDLQKPVMTAKDSSFLWGQVGIGTFDDHGNFDDVTLRGLRRDQ